MESASGKESNLRVILIASGDLWGGAESVVYNLLKGLDSSARIEAMLVTLNNARLANLCKAERIRTTVISEADNAFPVLVWNVRKLVRAFKPHIIHSHGYKENILAFLGRDSTSSCNLITTLHGLPEGYDTIKAKIANKLNFIVIKKVFDKLVTVSSDLRNILTNILQIDQDKVVVINNGTEITGACHKNFSNKRNFIIGSAGRLFPVKNYTLLVRIAKEVCSRNRGIRFVLAGDGPQKTLIYRMIKEYNLEKNFHLLGHVDEMSDFYRMIDIYINTSKHEGMPMTILEAMANGALVVAPRIGALPDIIKHKRNGWLVERNTVSGFVDIIERVINTDPKMLKDISKAAKETVKKNFSMEAMTRSYVQLYFGIISE